MKTLTRDRIIQLLRQSDDPNIDVYRIIQDNGNNDRYMWHPTPLVTSIEQLEAVDNLDIIDDHPQRDWYTLIEFEIQDILDELKVVT